MQRQLPSLERARWLPNVPRAAATLVSSGGSSSTNSAAAAPALRSDQARCETWPEPEPEPEPEPPVASTGNNRSRLHFHTMPGRWQMARWGTPPEGYCWYYHPPPTPH
jgi:hypothetical protein|eukprot:COSAG06_NODE_10926_length_1594_cov_43.794649_3_plen_108_part_00